MENVQQFIEGGIAGICVLLILLLGFILRWIFKLVGNHINSNTAILTKLSERIDRDIEAQDRTADALKDLKEVIRK